MMTSRAMLYLGLAAVALYAAYLLGMFVGYSVVSDLCGTGRPFTDVGFSDSGKTYACYVVSAPTVR